MTRFHVGDSTAEREWRVGSVDPAVTEAQWRAAGARSVTLTEHVRGVDGEQVARLVAEWGP